MTRVFAALVVGIVLFAIAQSGGEDIGAANSCRVGQVAAFAVVSGSRISGPGGVPSQFTSAQRYFARRYNCTGRLAQVRRVDRGIYEVRFPGNHGVAIVATGSMGTAASVQSLGQSTFRVFLLGPELEANALLPRDSGFVIILV